MNTKSLLITVLATALAGAAFANGKSPAELQQEAQLRAPASTLTRATVHAQVLQAQADGTLTRDGEQRWSTASTAPVATTLKRADVRADVLQARIDGTLTANGEQRWSEPATKPSMASVRHANVRADAAAALARGERLSQGDSNRNSPSVYAPHDHRHQTTLASRDSATAH